VPDGSRHGSPLGRRRVSPVPTTAVPAFRVPYAAGFVGAASPRASHLPWPSPNRPGLGSRLVPSRGFSSRRGRLRVMLRTAGRPPLHVLVGAAMLGPQKKRRLDAPVITSLEQLVPPDNFYRQLEAQLDLSFVRDWVGDKYAERGRPSIDPVVFFKLEHILFFEGLRSERKLIETAQLHLAHRWYLGYALDE